METGRPLGKYPQPDRRSVLRVFAGLGTGAFVGGVVRPPLSEEISQQTERLTGLPAGNAGSTAAMEAACPVQTEEMKAACLVNTYDSPRQYLISSVGAPTIEETLFRALPSYLLSLFSGAEKPFHDVTNGTDQPMFTRRELWVGIATSLLFGAVHNIRPDYSVDVRTIPASQTAGGLVYWYLCRRFGAGASIVSHGVYNWRMHSSFLSHLKGAKGK